MYNIIEGGDILTVGVLVEISNKSVDKIFDYNVPSSLESKIQVGVRVSVPFGKMLLEGFVLEIKDSADRELKDILDVVDDDIVLNDELIELGKEIKRRTLSPLISCYQVMLPKALKAKSGRDISIKYESVYSLNTIDCNMSFNSTQKQIIDLIKDKGKVSRRELVNISLSSLQTLIKKNILIEEKVEKYRLHYNTSLLEKKELTIEQSEVVNSVISSSPNCFLLYGVTGSGKTEVYMEIIDYYLSLGKSSILLVPEISLTPQMIERFQRRFGDRIAALHSGLSDGEKYDEWRRIARGEVSIVIGARSAVFAPLKDIGIIILDEEHSDSYKQSDANPRYHARDIALLRAKNHNCSVLLGSATPSLESMARAEKGVYKLLRLPNRVNGKKLPKVIIVDMNEAFKKTKGHFSNDLLESIRGCLLRGEQSILLLNRRGYASFVTCKNCGFTFKCPNCDITLTYHKSSNTLRCHYCGYGEKGYNECPKCHEKGLNNLGIGTQKIEEELKKYIPEARILRMDYDTTSKKGMHLKMIESFKNHEYDILLGTQMVAKGLDFANVTLVGVINADTSLNIPDFRSGENTFSLLSQVAGRSGRSEKEGIVIIQTFNPDHYAISYVQKHDYLSFYHQEMDIRRRLKYPPYYYLCCIKISGKDSVFIYQEALKIKRSLERNLDSVIILGPSNALVFKVNQIYRYQIILKYKKEDELYPIFSKIMEHYQINRNIKIDIDFNPLQVL